MKWHTQQKGQHTHFYVKSSPLLFCHSAEGQLCHYFTNSPSHASAIFVQTHVWKQPANCGSALILFNLSSVNWYYLLDAGLWNNHDLGSLRVWPSSNIVIWWLADNHWRTSVPCTSDDTTMVLLVLYSQYRELPPADNLASLFLSRVDQWHGNIGLHYTHLFK